MSLSGGPGAIHAWIIGNIVRLALHLAPATPQEITQDYHEIYVWREYPIMSGPAYESLRVEGGATVAAIHHALSLSWAGL